MRNAHSGFTLIELLVAVSLIGLVVVAATNLFFATIKGGQKSDVLVKIKQDGSYALNFIRTTIRNADTVDCSVDSIQINNPDGTITIFTLSADYRLISQSGGTDNYLTSTEFVVSNLAFSCSPAGPDQPLLVSIAFTLSTQTGSQQDNFQTTVSLRNY